MVLNYKTYNTSMEYVLLYPLPKFLCGYKCGVQEVGKKNKKPKKQTKTNFPFLCVEQNAFYMPTAPHPPSMG